jgi:ferritin-like metal-binding protein YciE
MPQLQELLTDSLRDIYDAEKQAVKAYPKLTRSISSPELKQAFTEHLEVTKNQVARVEQVFELLGERAKSKPCRAMQGLIAEAMEHLGEHSKGAELDSVLIAAAQKIEHYEIAAYGTARSMAKSAGQRQAAELLNTTLKEEGEADKRLSTIAIQIQKEMLQAEGEETQGAEEQEGRYAAGRSGGRGAARDGRSGSGRGMGSKKKVAAAGASSGQSAKRGGRNGASARGGSGSQTLGSGKAGTRVTTDHDEIREWAEERGAHPACVRGTGSKGDIGMIRLDFPGFSGEDSLEEITWDEFFQKFDEQGLALLYQEATARGQKSNFNKLVGRETAELASKGGRGSARRGTGRTAAKRR